MKTHVHDVCTLRILKIDINHKMPCFLQKNNVILVLCANTDYLLYSLFKT